MSVRTPDSPELAAVDVIPIDLNAALKEFLAQAGHTDALAVTRFDDACRIVTYGRQLETAGRIIQGWQFASVQQQGGRMLSELCRVTGTPRSIAYESIDYFRVFQVLPDIQSVRMLLDLGVTKVLALKHWSNEQLAALIEGKQVRGLNYVDALDLSVPEFVALAKPAEREEQLQRELDDSNAMVRGLEAQLAQLKRQFRAPESRLSPQYGAYRDETLYLTEKVQAEALRIASEGKRLLFDRDWREAPDAGDRQAAAAFAAQTLRGAFAPALAFLAELEQLYGEITTGGTPPGMRYTPEQADFVTAIRSAALESAELEQREARVIAMKRNGVRGRQPELAAPAKLAKRKANA